MRERRPNDGKARPTNEENADRQVGDFCVCVCIQLSRYESVMKIHKQATEARRALKDFKGNLLRQAKSGDLSEQEVQQIKARYNGVFNSLDPKTADLELTVIELEELIAIYDFALVT